MEIAALDDTGMDVSCDCSYRVFCILWHSVANSVGQALNSSLRCILFHRDTSTRGDIIFKYNKFRAKPVGANRPLDVILQNVG